MNKNIGFRVKKLKIINTSRSSRKFEFSTRISKNFILIDSKAGVILGEHWHSGKAVVKSPEIILLAKGKIDLSCRHVKTDVIRHKIISGPALIEIFPYWFHRVVTLRNTILLEFNSVKEHKADRFE